MSKVKALLHGFVDTHVHAGPTLTVREFDIWQLIQEAETGGFAAVVLKDHFIPTVPIARAIQEKLIETPVKIFGSLALNNSVGGINPKAVEIAIGFGAALLGQALWDHHQAHTEYEGSVHRFKGYRPHGRYRHRHHHHGHWEYRKIWVAPTYQKIWNPGHYNRRGRWVKGHWIEIKESDGFWRKERIWVAGR